jgi:hypothetical protein
MLINKQDITLLFNFLNEHDTENDRYNFPELSKRISEYLKTHAEFTVQNYYKNYFAQVWTERLTLTIVRGTEFVWDIYLKDTSLQGMLDAQHMINDLVDYKIAITEMYNGIQPELKRRIEMDALIRDCKWGQERLELFFKYFAKHFATNGKKAVSFESNEALKVLNKMKIEDWDEDFLFKSHGGKRDSIDYYRRLFTNFETCIKRIKNLQLNDIPA